MVEAKVPIPAPNNKVNNAVIISNPAAKKTGIKMGYNAIVSSPNPIVDPKIENRIIKIGISKISRFLNFFNNAKILAFNAWDLIIMFKKPPIANKKTIKSPLFSIPLIGAYKASNRPTGFTFPTFANDNPQEVKTIVNKMVKRIT
jgi:hypothetical protein